MMGRLGNGATTDQSSPVDVHTSADNSNTLSDIASVSGGGPLILAQSLMTLRLSAGEMEDYGKIGQWGNGLSSSYPVDVIRKRESGL